MKRTGHNRTDRSKDAVIIACVFNSDSAASAQAEKLIHALVEYGFYFLPTVLYQICWVLKERGNEN